MTRYIAIRILQGIIALIISSMIVFVLVRLTGDPVLMLLPAEATDVDIANLTAKLGLDKSYPEQYFIFITNILRGDLGNSIIYHAPVLGLIISRFPATLLLGTFATAISIVIALPAGVIAATHRQKWQDTTAKVTAIIGQSVPNFWLAIILIQVFSVALGWLPSAGYGSLKHLTLPSISFGFMSVAAVLRLTRSSMLDVLSADFVRLARIKGLSEGLVIWKHALRNALLPVVTFLGIHLVRMLAASVVIETIFAWPGVGRLAFDAVMRRDFPLEQGILLIFTALFIFFNLAVDILYCYLDPRVRYVKS